MGLSYDFERFMKYYRISWRRREMSDHLLLWVQLPIDFSTTHLSRFVAP
jgi:hypothetical protein